jgi:hypothetical protein
MKTYLGGGGRHNWANCKPRHQMLVSDLVHSLAINPPAGKKSDPAPTGQIAGWATEPVWTARNKQKSLAPVGNRKEIPSSPSP